MLSKGNGKKALRAALIMAMFVCVCMAGIVGTTAYRSHRIVQQNTLKSHSADIQIQESYVPSVVPGGTQTKEVAFKNTGSAPVFLRIAYSQSWRSSDGQLTGATGVTPNWTSAWSSDWERGSDGWYYYKKVLPKNGTTDKILNTVTFPADVPSGANYVLDFQAEVVQTSDENDVNRDATQTLFGRAGTVSNMQVENGAVVSGNVSWQ